MAQNLNISRDLERQRQLVQWRSYVAAISSPFTPFASFPYKPLLACHLSFSRLNCQLRGPIKNLHSSFGSRVCFVIFWALKLIGAICPQ